MLNFSSLTFVSPYSLSFWLKIVLKVFSIYTSFCIFASQGSFKASAVLNLFSRSALLIHPSLSMFLYVFQKSDLTGEAVNFQQ